MALLARNICKALSQVITGVPPLLRVVRAPVSGTCEVRGKRVSSVINNAAAFVGMEDDRAFERLYAHLYRDIFIRDAKSACQKRKLAPRRNVDTNPSSTPVQTRELVHVDRSTPRITYRVI